MMYRLYIVVGFILITTPLNIIAQEGSEPASKSFLADSLRIFCKGHYDAYNYFSALDCFHELLNEYETASVTEYYNIKTKLSWIYYNLGYVSEAEGLVKEAAEYFKDKNQSLYIAAALNQAWFFSGL